MSHLISCAINYSLLDIQILYGKYYLDTMLYKIFHHASLALYESHILYSWRGESSTVARGGYVEFWSQAVNLNRWQVETVIGKSLFVAFRGANLPWHLLVMNTLRYLFDYPLEKLFIVKRVAKVIYLIHEPSWKNVPLAFSVGVAIDVQRSATQKLLRVIFMLSSLVVRLYG